MPVILAVETSTQACSCAVIRDGKVYESFELIPRQHADKLLPMVASLLKDLDLVFTDLDAVAYGQGPGSFTGLRIASGVTQGIAYGAELPVIPVSTLASQAHQVESDEESVIIFSSLDARIDEVYWGFYRLNAGKLSLMGEEGLCKPEALPALPEEIPATITGVGSGLEYVDRMPDIYRESMSIRHLEIYPRASAVAELAEQYFQQGIFQSAENVNPVYLRDKVTHT